MNQANSFIDYYNFLNPYTVAASKELPIIDADIVAPSPNPFSLDQQIIRSTSQARGSHLKSGHAKSGQKHF